LENGRQNFKNKYYGIDAWDDVNNYEHAMISMLKRPLYGTNEVLGVDVRCGSPILEIKNKLKMFNSFDTYLSAFTEEAKYFIDLKTICQGQVECDRIEFISEHFSVQSFDYVVLGKPLNLYSEPLKALISILNLINENGQVLLKLRNINDVRTLSNIFGESSSYDEDYPVNWTIDDLQAWIIKLGYKIDKVLIEPHNLNEEYINTIKLFCEKNSIGQESYNRLIAKDYVISIVKN